MIRRAAQVLLFAAAAVWGQERPTFEVATIKPSNPGEISAQNPRRIGSDGPGRFESVRFPLLALIAQAYGVKTFQVLGGPEWIKSDGYDVTAKAEVTPEKGASRQKEMEDLFLRLQTLLEDRFALKFHRETRELPVYLLTVAKGGLKLGLSNCIVFDKDHPATAALGQARPAYCGNLMGERTGPNGRDLSMTGSGIHMKDLIGLISNALNRTVIDHTGVTEAFNGTLAWTPEPGSQFSPARPPSVDDAGKMSAPADAAGPSIFTALQEQLGLKLESAKGPVEVLVIDHVERPSAN